MSRRKKTSLKELFNNGGGWHPGLDLDVLRRGIEAGLLNEQDEYGLTALHLAVTSGWGEGVEVLLRAGAETELRHFRTGTTALYSAVQERNEPIVVALLKAGADPDAPNYWGMTARAWAARHPGIAAHLEQIPVKEVPLPEPWIQNAEHLADHYHPRFKIPDREERETLKVGQAVDLYVYGPKSETKQDTVKVRITKRSGRRPRVRYTATVETPMEQTHLHEGTSEVEFGPEHVASVYIPRPKKS